MSTPTEGAGSGFWALQGVLSGLSATRALNLFREAGGHIANQSWYSLYGQMQATAERFGPEFNRPQNAKPTANEIENWTTTKANSYVQQVEVLVRPIGTNEIISVPYTSMSSTLKTRQQVVREALDIYSDDNAAKYNQQVIAGVYTGTFRASPEG